MNILFAEQGIKLGLAGASLFQALSFIKFCYYIWPVGSLRQPVNFALVVCQRKWRVGSNQYSDKNLIYSQL